MSNDLDSRMLELLRNSLDVTGMPEASILGVSDERHYDTNNKMTSYFFGGRAWVTGQQGASAILHEKGYLPLAKGVPFSDNGLSKFDKLLREKSAHLNLFSKLSEIFGDKAKEVYGSLEHFIDDGLIITDVQRFGHKAMKVVAMTIDEKKVMIKVQDVNHTKIETDVLRVLNALGYEFAPILFKEPAYTQNLGIHATYDVNFNMFISNRIPPKETKGDPIALKIYSIALLHSMTSQIRMKTSLPEYKFTPEVFIKGLEALEYARNFLPIDEIKNLLLGKFQMFMKSGEASYFGQSKLGRLAYTIINGDPRDENIVKDINVDWNSSAFGPYAVDLAKASSEIPRENRDYYLQLYINFRNDLEPEFKDLGVTLDDVKRDMKLKPYVLLRAAGTRVGESKTADAYSCMLFRQAAYS